MLKTVNSTDELIEGILNFGPEILNNCLYDPENPDVLQYIEHVNQEHLNYPVPPTALHINNWYIPNEYKDLDIEKYLVSICPKENYDRLSLELDLYRKKDMLVLLKTMKYIVDTLRTNNIVWGVGRGSSVASYVLFLLGVHKVDSIKYNLPIEEFFKEI